MTFGKRVDVPGGKRRMKRRPVHILGSATTAAGVKPVVLADLCLLGARLLGRDLPPAGSEIMVHAHDRTIAGRIAWADENRRGVIFG